VVTKNSEKSRNLTILHRRGCVGRANFDFLTAFEYFQNFGRLTSRGFFQNFGYRDVTKFKKILSSDFIFYILSIFLSIYWHPAVEKSHGQNTVLGSDHEKWEGTVFCGGEIFRVGVPRGGTRWEFFWTLYRFCLKFKTSWQGVNSSFRNFRTMSSILNNLSASKFVICQNYWQFIKRLV